MAAERTLINEWLYTTLFNDATLTGLCAGRIYLESAPPESPYPFIVYYDATPGAGDVMGVGSIRIMTEPVYVVKAVDNQPNLALVKPIADRIDDVLHRAKGSVPGGSILGCRRESELMLGESEEGAEFRHLGAYYRVYAQESGASAYAYQAPPP